MSNPVPARPQPAPGAPQTGKRLYWAWWLVGCVLFLAAGLPWAWKRIHWRALAALAAVFVGAIFLIESLALHWQWWAWNAARLLGPRIGLVPLEEFLTYFTIVPVLVVMQTMLQRLLRRRKGDL